ncbi:S-methyl-5-thioribose kinase [Sinisalibacter aestuarii]|uniref:S-methyl-5-thioribose kinase n=1 Tax=Sinisalibacter aestuarii TaxID=2949426 RepID=A0ABQ5LMF3_9RHOB|nr:S-methyl-5-thioribose kinase [Sinisalibacter aestuarii]GKY86139.1 methylthioribose kinase [Sinisalibacter aestuarii]
MTQQDYEALSPDTLAARLGPVDSIRSHLGDPEKWRVREVGDGNLNLVFIVDGPEGSVIVKQALPYVRLVGDSWPLPLKRAFFEYNALIRQEARDPGSVPQVFHFDETQAMIAMEFLQPHVILRKVLIDGGKVEGLAEVLGKFCARTLFRGSDLSMPTADRKADAAMFLGNVEICDITENLVFSDPYFDAEMNHHTPALDPVVKILRDDIDLKVTAQHMKSAFANNAETMLHGDLHSGSVMVTDTETKVIDPEFVTYGPVGFDVGMLIANFLHAYISQPGHASAPGARDDYQEWILSVIDDIWSTFEAEFSHLWRTERNGILYQASLFEDQGHARGSEQARIERLTAIWRDMLGFCGIEMHRRILSLAHNADFETIEDEATRARLEARALMLGRTLAVARGEITSMAQVLDLARQANKEEYL